MVNISKKLAVTTAGLALSCVAMEANPAEAAVFTYDFTVDITEGPLVGNQYSGSLSYDDSSELTAFGGYRLSDFMFDFEGTTYNESDLIYEAGGYGGFFPNAGLQTASSSYYASQGNVLFPYLLLLTPGYPQPYASFYGSTGGICTAGSCPSSSSGSVTYQLRPPSPPTSVPEPGTLGGLLFLGLSSLFLKRKS